MTTQLKDLMMLDEMLAEIKDRLKTAQRCLEANLRSQAEGKETLELAVRLNGEDVRFHTSALHHLEAGKDKRYTPQDMIFAAAFGINKLGENFPELKSTAPTAQEVKG